MKNLFCFLVFFWLSFCEGFAHTGEAEELALARIYAINTLEPGLRMDLSGLTHDGSGFYVISDTSTQNEIYQLNLDHDKNEASLKAHASFPRPWLKSYLKRNAGQGRFDLEGITWCQGGFYLAEESTRSILSLNLKGMAEEHPLGFDKFHAKKGKMSPFSGVRNAGLEAIACDENKGLLYVFNERQFRMGYVYSLKEKKLLEQFDFPSGNTLPRFEKSFWIYPDFAGADFHGGKLYVLVRNQRLILEVDPESYAVLRRLSFARHTEHLYQKNDPFGLAEGLVVRRDKFYIVLDNNGHPRRNNQNDIRPVLLILKRGRRGKL